MVTKVPPTLRDAPVFSASLSGMSIHAAMAMNETPRIQRMASGPIARVSQAPAAPAMA
ncbi:hypothetical protein D3C83_133680 [compost metagenome]